MRLHCIDLCTKRDHQAQGLNSSEVTNLLSTEVGKAFVAWGVLVEKGTLFESNMQIGTSKTSFLPWTYSISS